MKCCNLTSGSRRRRAWEALMAAYEREFVETSKPRRQIYRLVSMELRLNG